MSNKLLSLEPFFLAACDIPLGEQEEYVIKNHLDVAEQLIALLRNFNESHHLLENPVYPRILKGILLERWFDAFCYNDRHYTVVDILNTKKDTVTFLAKSPECPHANLVIKSETSTGSSPNLFKEYSTLKDISNLNVPKAIHDGQSTKGSYYFVMRRIPGFTLDQYLDVKKPDILAVLQIFVKMCECLEALHHHNIVHLDIKPSNIIVNPCLGDVTIIDFETSKGCGEPILNKSKLVGTPDYFCTELLGSKTFDIFADLYSLGILFYKISMNWLQNNYTEDGLIDTVYETYFDPVVERAVDVSKPGHFKDAREIIESVEDLFQFFD